MMPNHSPGPWQLTELQFDECGQQEHDYRIEAKSTLLLNVSPCADGFQWGQNRANAILIQHAPCLLAMLERVRETCHMSEDPSLGVDIDKLIAAATDQPYVGPPDDEDEQDDED